MRFSRQNLVKQLIFPSQFPHVFPATLLPISEHAQHSSDPGSQCCVVTATTASSTLHPTPRTHCSPHVPPARRTAQDILSGLCDEHVCHVCCAQLSEAHCDDARKRCPRAEIRAQRHAAAFATDPRCGCTRNFGNSAVHRRLIEHAHNESAQVSCCAISPFGFH